MAKDFLKVHKGITFKDQGVEPTNPVDGDVYFDTALVTLRLRKNGVWVDLTKGSGDASSILETLKNQLQDSTYNLLTANIFSIDEEDKVDGSSTGTYNLVDGSYDLESGETMVSTQMLDPDEFLALGKGLSKIDLSVFWNSNSIDEVAIYEVSRNSGNEWQTVDMSRVGEATETYYGSHEFAIEATNDTLIDNSDGNDGETVLTLNDTGVNGEKLAQQFIITNTSLVREVTFLNTVAGSPVGSFYIQIITDNAGIPSTDPLDILLESSAIAASSVSNGSNTFSIGEVLLVPGTYHVVIRSDDIYKASVGSNNIKFQGNNSTNGNSFFNTATWTNNGTVSMRAIILGIELDLRVRVTAGTNGVALDGYGIFYDNDPVTVVDNVLQLEVRKFKAVADNFSTFALTNFLPNADLLKVYYVEGGQVFHYGAFTLQGQSVIFPANTFNNNGVEADITLIFDQVRGGAYDNSDTNASLLSANFLGSTDGTIDKSQAGRGISLRRVDGSLVESSIGQWAATNTNDDAGVGKVGEYVSNALLVGSAISLTTNIVANITSITLTAGDWDVSAIAAYNQAASTSVTQRIAAISKTSATLPSLLANPQNGEMFLSDFFVAQVPGIGQNTLDIPTIRISLTTTTTIYLVVRTTFTVSTATAFGSIWARRVR